MKALLLALPVLSCLLLAAELSAEEASEAIHAEAAKPVGSTDMPASVHAIRKDIRLLFRLQDMASGGNPDSLELQKLLLLRIGKALQEPDAAASAALIAPEVAGYVLSGGNPQVAIALAGAEGLAAGKARLLRGAAAFMRGDRETAARDLEGLDPLSLTPSVTGRVALAQAIYSQEHGERQRLFAIAIAAMPGSMIEESALRRSALAFAEAGHEASFWSRAMRYVRRYPQSPYLPEFMSGVLAAVADMEAQGRDPDRHRLDLLFIGMSKPIRQRLYLELARTAAYRNARRLAEFAARRLERLAVPGGQEWQLAQLYKHLYLVADTASATSAAALRSLDASLLMEQDAALWRAALSVADQIDAPLDLAGGTAGLDATDRETEVLESRVSAVIADAEALLKGQSR